MVAGLAGSRAAVGFAFAFALACWAMQLSTKLRRFMKWIAEYFLAACALHDAWTSADTFCLLVAASADTAKDMTRAVAIAEISSFFMFVSPISPPQWQRNDTRWVSVPNNFPVSLFRNSSGLVRSECAFTTG